jgi:hypothetical protein
MSSVTFYFNPAMRERFLRIKEHLGLSVLSELIAHILMVAEREYERSPGLRPWEEDLPGGAAARHTVYLRERSADRFDWLKTQMEKEEGELPASEIIARAVALAERPVLACSAEDIEVMRISSDATAIDVEVSNLAEQIGEDVIDRLVACLGQLTKLYERAQRVQNATSAGFANQKTRQTWADACAVMYPQLNDIFRKTTEAITSIRHALDRQPAHP